MLPTVHNENSIVCKNKPPFVRNPISVRKNPLRKQYLNKLCNIKCKTALMTKSFFGNAPKIYNKVPDVIKIMPLMKFKKALSTLLIDKCYYTLDEFLTDLSI